MGRYHYIATTAEEAEAPARPAWRLTNPTRGPARRPPARRPPMRFVCISCDRAYSQCPDSAMCTECGGEVEASAPLTCKMCGGKWRDPNWFWYHPCVDLAFRELVIADFVSPEEAAAARKCSPFARARSRNLSVIQREVRQERKKTGRKRKQRRRLPVLRSTCANQQRPCGYLTCRHHNALVVDEDNGSIKEVLPQLRIIDNPKGPGLLVLEQVMGTCDLDVCDGRDDGSQGVNALQELREKAEAGRPIGDPENGMTLEEVAEILHISVERVRQLGASGMKRMRLAIWQQQEGRLRGK